MSENKHIPSPGNTQGETVTAEAHSAEAQTLVDRDIKVVAVDGSVSVLRVKAFPSSAIEDDGVSLAELPVITEGMTDDDLVSTIARLKSAASSAHAALTAANAAIGRTVSVLRDRSADRTEYVSKLEAAGLPERLARRCLSIYKEHSRTDVKQMMIEAAEDAAAQVHDLDAVSRAAEAGVLDGVDFENVRQIDAACASRMKADLSAGRQHRTALACLARAAIQAHPLPQTAPATIAAAAAWSTQEGGAK